MSGGRNRKKTSISQAETPPKDPSIPALNEFETQQERAYKLYDQKIALEKANAVRRYYDNLLQELSNAISKKQFINYNPEALIRDIKSILRNNDSKAMKDTKIAQKMMLEDSGWTQINDSGMNNLQLAAFHGNNNLVKFLISSNVNDINVVHPPEYITVLHAALMQPKADKHETKIEALVDFLLTHKANPNLAKKPNGETALQLAIEQGRLNIVKLLLLNGADPALPLMVDGKLNSFMDMMIKPPMSPVKLVNFLISLNMEHPKKGNDLLVRTLKEATPACKEIICQELLSRTLAGELTQTEQKQIEILMNALLTSPAKEAYVTIMAQGLEKWMKQHDGTVEGLNKKNTFLVQAMNYRGDNDSRLGAIKKIFKAMDKKFNRDFMQRLDDHRSEVSQKNMSLKEGWIKELNDGIAKNEILGMNSAQLAETLHVMQDKSPRIISGLLMQNSASSGISNLGRAIMTGRVELAHMLIQQSSTEELNRSVFIQPSKSTVKRPFPLHAAINAPRENEAILKALIDKGVNLNVVSTSNETALYQAAKRGKFELAKILLLAGANPAVKSVHVSGSFEVDQDGNIKDVGPSETSYANYLDAAILNNKTVEAVKFFVEIFKQDQPKASKILNNSLTSALPETTNKIFSEILFELIYGKEKDKKDLYLLLNSLVLNQQKNLVSAFVEIYNKSKNKEIIIDFINSSPLMTLIEKHDPKIKQQMTGDKIKIDSERKAMFVERESQEQLRHPFHHAIDKGIPVTQVANGIKKKFFNEKVDTKESGILERTSKALKEIVTPRKQSDSKKVKSTNLADKIEVRDKALENFDIERKEFGVEETLNRLNEDTQETLKKMINEPYLDKTPLQYAIEKNKWQEAVALLEMGADVLQTKNFLTTALQRASQDEFNSLIPSLQKLTNMEFREMLIGVNENLLEHALKNKNDTFFNFLIERMPKDLLNEQAANALLNAINLQDKNAVVNLLKIPEICNSEKYILSAIEKGNTEIAKGIINAMTTTDLTNNAPNLMRKALIKPNVEMVSLLVEKLSVSIGNQNAQSAFHFLLPVVLDEKDPQKKQATEKLLVELSKVFSLSDYAKHVYKECKRMDSQLSAVLRTLKNPEEKLVILVKQKEICRVLALTSNTKPQMNVKFKNYFFKDPLPLAMKNYEKQLDRQIEELSSKAPTAKKGAK